MKICLMSPGEGLERTEIVSHEIKHKHEKVLLSGYTLVLIEPIWFLKLDRKTWQRTSTFRES